MKRQRGQTLVEFALMAPMICLLVFGMIYGGAMFMQYLYISNEVRTIAREMSVLENSEETTRDKIKKKYEDFAESNFPSFYKSELSISYTYEKKEQKDADGNVVKDDKGKILYVEKIDEDGNVVKDDEGKTVYEDDTDKPVDVVVKVTFTRDNGDLPWILYKTGFPPKELKPIVYQMRLEKKYTDDSTDDDSTT